MKSRKNRIRFILYSALGAIIISVLVIGSGAYAQSTLNPSELSHFFVPFPAGMITHPQTVSQLDHSQIFVRPITINVDERGILKKWLNPSVEGLSTHWLDNIDTIAHRIGLKFTNTEDVEVEWDVHAGISWDTETHTFDVPIGPGERVDDLGVDWLFFFSDEVMEQEVWYDGALIVFDADTDETLTIIPIKFQKSTAAVPAQSWGK